MKGRVRQSVRSLKAYAPGEQPGDSARPMIKLNTNENPYPPSPSAGAALSAFNLEDLRLYPDPECVKLRHAIADLHGCSMEQVFVGNGSDEILALSTRAFVENDGTIGFFLPSYSLYQVLADIREVETRPCVLSPNFEWRMPEDYSASLFFLANPNAPTGIRYPREIIRKFCGRFKGIVLIDEAYAAFAEEDCMALAIEMENVLAARTLSKSHSLAGLRLGYAVGPAPLIEALFKIKDSYNLGRIEQHVGLNAILDEETMKRNVARIRHTRNRCAKRLEQLGFEIYPSETNFLWVRPPAIEAELFFRKLRERYILVRFFPGPRTGSFLRITIGTDEEMDVFLNACRLIIGK